MDWFSRWPRDALIAVSGHFLNNFEIVSTEETKTQIMNTMGVVHDNVAAVCVEYFQRHGQIVNCLIFLMQGVEY